MKILILGSSGMLGHRLLETYAKRDDFDVVATVRTPSTLLARFPHLKKYLRHGVEADNIDSIIRVLAETRPDCVINCIGVIKQLPSANDPVAAIAINSLFPHRLAWACQVAGARLIHISTDCVFDGLKGNYVETDPSDAKDFYGRSKFLGEVDYPHAITLRTSIIGHELGTSYGLVEWFLKQKSKTRGYQRAIFSGLTTLELAKVIADVVLPNTELHGLYHVASEPISKYDLLRMIAARYGKTIDIEADSAVVLDRSLDASRFRSATHYSAPHWEQLIDEMRAAHVSDAIHDVKPQVEIP